MRKIVPAPVIVMALGLMAASPALAQGDHKINLGIGYFSPRGEDARSDRDVLIENRTFLTFDISELGNVFVNGEYLFGLTEYLEAGIGLGYYKGSVPSLYTDYVDIDGSEIEQEFSLRIVPITASVRFLPLGRFASVQPYVGAGLGILPWKYSEIGEFVDFADFSIFQGRFIDSGTALGPVILGGVNFNLGDRYGVGGEIRYQRGEGELSDDFLNDRIDLGGITYQAVFQIKF
ncbi:MAG: outer membrane beta-barrel protein [Vicinamibacterales bacterium]